MLEHENGKCWGKGKNQWEVKKTSGSEKIGGLGRGKQKQQWKLNQKMMNY